MHSCASFLVKKSSNIELPPFVEDTIDIALIVTGSILILSIIGLIITRVLYMRSKKVGIFMYSILDALLIARVLDMYNNITLKYDFEDIEKCMWSFDKMLYTFWVKNPKKMFYDPDFYTYIEPILSLGPETIKSIKANLNSYCENLKKGTFH